MTKSTMTFLVIAFMNLQAQGNSQADFLPQALTCYNSLIDLSSGTSTDLEVPPVENILLVKNQDLYVFSNKSVLKFKPLLSEEYQKLSLDLSTDSNLPQVRKIAVKKTKSQISIQSVDFTSASEKETKDAIKGLSAKDPSNEKILSQELVRRIISMPGEYQSRYKPSDTLQKLETCDQLEDEQIQAAIRKSRSYYEGLVKKKTPSKYRDNSGAK